MKPYFETDAGIIYQGHVLEVLNGMEAESVQKRNRKGQFTQGSHWREQKPYWVKSWLQYEYTIMCKSAAQIAQEQGCRENNVLYFLNKHSVPRRTMRQIRRMKH